MLFILGTGYLYLGVLRFAYSSVGAGLQTMVFAESKRSSMFLHFTQRNSLLTVQNEAEGLRAVPVVSRRMRPEAQRVPGESCV